MSDSPRHHEYRPTGEPPKAHQQNHYIFSVYPARPPGDAVARLALWAAGTDNPSVLDRYLHRRDGSLRYWRLVSLLAVCFAMAIFGGALIWIAPRLTTDPWLRATWVIFAIGLLKLPLILLLWSFIRRNSEWPGRPVAWSDDETAAILANITMQAEHATGRPDCQARLAYLSREAWHVADNVSGAAKVDALTVALRIDERLIARRERDVAG